MFQFDLSEAHVKNPALFLFGRVDSLLGAENGLFEGLNRIAFHTCLNIGFESADPATLSAINKPLELKQIENAFSKMLDINRQYLNIEITAIFLIKMNCSAASRGVWRYVKLHPNAASCGELNPAEFAVCIPQSV